VSKRQDGRQLFISALLTVSVVSDVVARRSVGQGRMAACHGMAIPT
jgi:hypothetical protein